MLTNSYLDFENKFRGDRQSVIDTLSIYDPLIDLIVGGDPSPKLIDIGCGRGEWLQKYNHRFEDVFGIESNKEMIKICKEYNLKVIEGDAIDMLSKFDNKSVNVITLFHLIEHLEYRKLIKLLKECERVLKNDGLLIAETPNIDSVLVSTKSFHIDPTHINPIHADLVSFDLLRIGFSNVKTYDVHPGPLKNASPLKITRVLNGVAQDLSIIATKKTEVFETLMKKTISWETPFSSSITTLKAAVEHDLKLEKVLDEYKQSDLRLEQSIDDQKKILDDQKQSLDDQKQSLDDQKQLLDEYKQFDLRLEQSLDDQKKILDNQKQSIDDQKILLDEYKKLDENNRLIIEEQALKLSKLDNEIIHLKSQLKLVIFISKIIRKILRPLKLIFLFLKKSILILFNIRKLILILCNYTFNFLIRYKILRDLLISKRVLRIINFLLNSIKGSSSITTTQIQNKVNKLLDRDTKFILQNKKLSLHHRLSLSSELYKEIFTKKK